MNRKPIWPPALLAVAIGLRLLPAYAADTGVKSEAPPAAIAARHPPKIRHQRLHHYHTATVTVEVQRGQIIIRPRPQTRPAATGTVVSAVAR